MAHRSVSATRVIDAAPSVIFDLLADPAKHPLIDGSGHVQASRGPSQRLALGSTFSMDMREGLPYFTKNRVVEFEEDRRIAWHHFAQFIWRYELEPVDGGTKVTETFDYSVPWGVTIIPLGYPERNRTAMEKTLERIAEVVAAPPTPGDG
jgi:uncharacterized protein YndB with AHSA1/START domain